jgi:hypothetical protein
MPQNRNNPEPPKVMTWAKALPELCLGGLADVLRYFFLCFWFFGAPAIEAFGTIMAIAVGFAGWLIVTFVIVAKNRRVFAENPFSLLWLLAGIGASVSIMTWRIYRAQIKKDKVAYAKWKKAQSANQSQERQQQALRAAELMQAQAAQLAPAEI